MDMVILDVKPHLNLIEDVFNRYLYIKDEELLRFVSGLRFPTNISKVPVCATSGISNKPFYLLDTKRRYDITA